MPTRCTAVNNPDTRDGVGVLGGEYVGVPGGAASSLHREKVTELGTRNPPRPGPTHLAVWLAPSCILGNPSER